MSRGAAMAVVAAILAAGPARAQFGVYEGAGCDGATRVAAFTRWAGRAPDRVLDFVASGTWQDIQPSVAWEIGCWNGHGHPALTLTLPLTVKGTDLAEVASGRFDPVFAKAAAALVAGGYADAILRLGPEMNGAWFPGGNLADPDPARQARRVATYKAAFARIVGVLRAVPGARFRIDWCPNSGSQQIAQEDVYPGDDVVDIVGTDLYAVVWGVEHPDAARVEAALGQGWHLDAVAEFGRLHGKPISFPEWGVGDRPSGRANFGPGDSPEVMGFLLRWFSAHAPPPGRPARPGQIAYTDYWDYDAGDYNARVSNGERPREGEVLKRWSAASGPRSEGSQRKARPDP